MLALFRAWRAARRAANVAREQRIREAQARTLLNHAPIRHRARK